ncbi:MAG TPA: bifunctional diguanylate cyclase/phosphodiesterase [Ardenticatenaceae bacterium]|nr:bifunctional diguanylate cyclase/phosphodiesterase [Ardenticatenaceae bacterium]
MLFDDRLAQTLARSDRTREPCALLYIDVDRFKLVNDTLGHQAGDELLCQLVRRLLQNLRKTDTLARLGGDEFALVIPDLKDPAGADIVAAKLIGCLQAPFEVAGREIFVTVSIGTAVYLKDAHDALSLQKSADAAMYRAKASGRNQAKSYDAQMTIPDTERLELVSSLRKALNGDELLLHYQPVVDRESRVVAFEALVRWNHPTLGLLPPGRFIGIAEETGLILPLGTWVLHEAVRQNKQWQDAGLPPVKVSVNVSAMQFAQPLFVEGVRSALDNARLDPKWLQVELTETVLMHNFAEGAHKLDALRSLGVSVAIDDFGTGYSSLAYLQRLPVDTLKIDRTFVSGIPAADVRAGERNETAVIRAVTLLAQSLGMQTVAEGVENQLQRTVLLSIGCDLLQGYLFSKPLSPAHAEVMLKTGISSRELTRRSA